MKILYFYPENPILINQGNNSRANTLLSYFKSRGITVDYVGETGDYYNNNDVNKLIEEKYVNKGFLVKNRRTGGINYLFKHSIPNKIRRIFKKPIKHFNRVTYGYKIDFDNFLKDNSYDYIIISYVTFTAFITNKKLLKNAKIIVDTHDFLTAQFQNFKGFKLGKYFETEIKLLNKYDYIWTISAEENFIFSQFLPQKDIITIAHGIENKSHLKNNEAKIDIFYVASNNPHNVKSAKWFFKNVHPLLPKNVNITIVGKICNVISNYDNVNKVVFAEDLDTYYRDSKITICPMLSGTGLKIKVVESLSYGIPVVCNERGVDGLLCKINNGCLVTNDATEFAKNITDLLSSTNFYNTHAKNAREFFANSLDKDIINTKLDYFFNIK